MTTVGLRIGLVGGWRMGGVGGEQEEDGERRGGGMGEQEEDGEDEDWGVEQERKSSRGKRKRPAPRGRPRRPGAEPGTKRRRAAAANERWPAVHGAPPRGTGEPSLYEGVNAVAAEAAAAATAAPEEADEDDAEYVAPSTSARGGAGRKPDGGRGRRRSCHQCKRATQSPKEMIRCELCEQRIYCVPCVRKR
jgi:lysine-specific demethylase 3